MFQGSSLTKFGSMEVGKVCAEVQLAAGDLTDQELCRVRLLIGHFLSI